MPVGVYKHLGNRRGTKLSEETRKKISESTKKAMRREDIRKKISGKNSPNWKGGISSINELERKRLEYKLWRKSVFERDNYTCQKYGIKGGILHPHHINNFAEYPELRFAIDNGITLSEKAHREFHKIYGSVNNTMEQIEEFINTC